VLNCYGDEFAERAAEMEMFVANGTVISPFQAEGTETVEYLSGVPLKVVRLFRKISSGAARSISTSPGLSREFWLNGKGEHFGVIGYRGVPPHPPPPPPPAVFVSNSWTWTHLYTWVERERL